MLAIIAAQKRPPHHAPRINRRGVTLVELVIVLLVIGIVSAAAVPKYAASLSRFRVDMAAQRIARDLAFVKRQAISNSTTATVQFVPATETYSVSGVAGIDRRGTGFSVDLAVDPYRVDVTSASFNGGQTISFDRYGAPSAGGQVVVAIGGYQQTITVESSTGRATVP